MEGGIKKKFAPILQSFVHTLIVLQISMPSAISYLFYANSLHTWFSRVPNLHVVLQQAWTSGMTDSDRICTP